jgi:hypothetical protein
MSDEGGINNKPHISLVAVSPGDMFGSWMGISVTEDAGKLLQCKENLNA